MDIFIILKDIFSAIIAVITLKMFWFNETIIKSIIVKKNNQNLNFKK